MRTRFPFLAAQAAAAFLVFLALGQSAWAQGCILCYTTASSLNKKGIHALDKAILVIGLPAVFLFIGIFVFLYRRRNACREAAAADPAPRNDRALGRDLPDPSHSRA